VRPSEVLSALNYLSLAVDPQTTTTIYAGTGGSGVLKTTDGGVSWNNSWAVSGVGITRINQLVIDPATPSTLYAVGEAQPAGPAAPTIPLNTFKSTDGGATWAVIQPANVLAVDPGTPTTVYIGTDNGVFKSTNGSTFTAVGLADLLIHSLLVDPINTANIYAGTFNDRRERDAIYKSTDRGASWERTEGTGRLLAINPSAPATLYSGTPDGLLKSTDAGNSWKPSDLVGLSVRALAINPTSTETLYAGTDGGADAFITKINSTGTALIYSTYIGGKGHDAAYAIAIDAAGAAYITGETSSDDFPVRGAFQQRVAEGEFRGDAFVTEIDAAGAALVFSSYLGGGNTDGGLGIAVDSSGGVYVTGFTASTDFPTVTSLQPRFAGGTLDGFVAKIASPRILAVTISGKKLRVTGEGFAADAVILIDNAAQKTANDAGSPTTVLIGKKAAKSIAPGQRITVQVRNPDGSLSNQFSFVRPGN
jgi:hypothetical protein